MELKYYLRGLGLGIIVTAIIMGVAASRKQTMTDEEIIARAKQLGMIEDTVLSGNASLNKSIPDGNDSDNNPDDDDVSGADILETGEQELNETGAALDEMSKIDEIIQNEQSNTASNETEEEQEDDKQLTAETSNEDEVQTVMSDVPVVVTIGSGDGSYSVSRKLADVGAVDSAEDFDTFLCSNGYDKRIITGTHTIPAGADDAQIARIITGAE